MIEKTEALALRIRPYSETSRIVTWLTPAYGLLTTIVKGACRPKSPFLGQIDIPDTCELLFYARETNGMHIARECSPLLCRSALRRNWRQYVCAEYACLTLLRSCTAGAPHHAVFGQIGDFLDHLCRQAPHPALLPQWELRLLKTLGVAPQLDACSRCGTRREIMAPNGKHRLWSFSATRGGLVCDVCADDSRPADADPEPRPAVTQGKPRFSPAPPDSLAIMAQWLRARSARSAERTRCTPRQQQTVVRMVGDFFAFHLDMPPAPRHTVLALLSRDPQQWI